jgi:dTDP-4-dehydrorhamnose reductase
MKILLFGKNGQVGWELQRSLAPLGQLVAVNRASVELCGDLNDLDGIRRTVRTVRPDVIVNAAAYTSVDRAESEPDQCRKINALAPEIMAVEAGRLGAWMVHYSSDYVFNGSGEMPWTEGDPPAPVNVYGASKAEGDERILAACSTHLLFRTSWVYAARGSNFVNTILRLGRERDRVAVVNDQHGAPTGAELIADVTAHAILVATRCRDLAGIYHLVPRGVTTWFSYAQFVLALAREAGLPAKAELEGVTSASYPTVARRPHNSRLDNKKLQAVFGLHLPEWQDGVAHVLAGKAGPD